MDGDPDELEQKSNAAGDNLILKGLSIDEHSVNHGRDRKSVPISPSHIHMQILPGNGNKQIANQQQQ